MTQVGVSVILATYRRGHLIARALRSVLTQSMADLEVLVIDDVPGDNTEEVVRSFADPRVRYISHPERRGVSAARNQGIALARGKYIAFQDSDDEWLADKLQQQFDRMESLSPEYAITQGAVLRFEAGWVQRLHTALPRGSERSAILECNETTFLQSWLARRDVLQSCGGFDERLPLWEDWELLIRICQQYRVDLDPRIMAVIYDTPGSLIKQGQRRRDSMQMIVDRHRALMEGNPGALARNLYVIARFQIMEGTDARGLLWQSLRLAPRQARTWILLLASMLGGSVLARPVLGLGEHVNRMRRN